MKLTERNVTAVFKECMFNEGEPTDGHIVGHGITIHVSFHPVRLEANRENVRSMLTHLPHEFRKSHASGGASFLTSCMQEDGSQWTGMQKAQQELFMLGLALGLVAELLPRDMWSVLPGGMPYYALQF